MIELGREYFNITITKKREKQAKAKEKGIKERATRDNRSTIGKPENRPEKEKQRLSPNVSYFRFHVHTSFS